MKMDPAIWKIITVLKVADAKTVGNVIFATHDFKNLHSARVQAQKHLNLLAETGKIIRGRGWYAIKDYAGQFGDHDRAVTDCIVKLLLLGLPVTIHREVSLPIGLRSDAIGLVGKNGRGLCFLLEVCVNETDAYYQQKVAALRNWKEATAVLSDLFGTPIPYFALVVHGKRHPEVIEFNEFLEALK